MENNKSNKQEDCDDKHIRFIIIVFMGLFVFSLIFPVIYRNIDNTPPVISEIPVEQRCESVSLTGESVVGRDTTEWNEPETMSKTTVTVSEAPEDTCVTVVFPLNLNTASVEELMMVKGIGEKTAEKIVDYRYVNGYFYSLDDLLNVDGIGEKKLTALNGYLYIDHSALPETLPESTVIETEPITTSVPYENDESESLTTVVTMPSEEDFIMETEEFIIDTDDEFESESEDWYDENFNFSTTEKAITEKYYPNFPLELNSATAQDLTYISGIGEATAHKIVEYARTVGFTKVEDLLNVSGIGQSKLEMIRPYVYVNSIGITENTFYVTDNEDQTLPQVTTDVQIPEIYSVNINTCGKNDLMQLPGIDENLADSILELRARIGYFKNIEELSFVLSNEKLSGVWNYVYV